MELSGISFMLVILFSTTLSAQDEITIDGYKRAVAYLRIFALPGPGVANG